MELYRMSTALWQIADIYIIRVQENRRGKRDMNFKIRRILKQSCNSRIYDALNVDVPPTGELEFCKCYLARCALGYEGINRRLTQIAKKVSSFNFRQTCINRNPKVEYL